MISIAGSAQEGTYTAHPNQMMVRLPRNVEDEVLERGDMTEDLPLTHPTSMSYPLQRIRLGEISRSAIDTLRFGLSDPSDQDYKQILQLDERVKHFLEDLPVFLKIDQESIRKSQYILERYPHIAMQRYIINVGAQSVRCKLHHPFLVRGGREPQYAESARIAISSAMAIVGINNAIRMDPTQYIPNKVKLTALLHQMFLATVVLVMDLCFNRLGSADNPRHVDVINAISILEEAREGSVSVQKFLDSLTEALRKHQICLDGLPGERRINEAAVGSASSRNSQTWSCASDAEASGQVSGTGIPNISQPSTMGFDDFWRGGVDQTELNALPDWDQLFSELDTFIA